MTITHTVDATLFEGFLLRFRPHYDASIPTIHHSFNSVYAVDLYDNKFHFLLDDVGTNGQNQLFKDAPERLQAHMVHNIKNVSGATQRVSRAETDKIDKLFGKMEISYALNNGKVVNFQQGQDLATRMTYFIKHQRPEVPIKCMEILSLTSNI